VRRALEGYADVAEWSPDADMVILTMPMGGV
jgi:hypothetical protein